MYYAELDDGVSDSNASVPSAYIIGDYCLGLGIDGNIVNISAWHGLNSLKRTYSKYLKVPKSKRNTEISDFLSMIFVTSTLISNISDYDEEEEVPLLSSTLNWWSIVLTARLRRKTWR